VIDVQRGFPWTPPGDRPRTTLPNTESWPGKRTHLPLCAHSSNGIRGCLEMREPRVARVSDAQSGPEPGLAFGFEEAHAGIEVSLILLPESRSLVK
jgi:hypothetical protein